MVRSGLADGPRAVAFSLGGVLILIALMMRSMRATTLTLSTLLAGVGVMLGAAAVLGMKLNFLNFVAGSPPHGGGGRFLVQNGGGGGPGAPPRPPPNGGPHHAARPRGRPAPPPRLPAP